LPELPEVESLTRSLRAEMVGRTFSGVKFLRADIREPIPCDEITRSVKGETVKTVERRGKYMLISTERGTVGVHLGMTGRFLSVAKDAPMEKHTHAIFQTTCGQEYRFIDPRRFGRLFHIAGKDVCQHPFLARLGMEPLAQSRALARHLFDVSRTRRQAVKMFLMDHEVVVGIGNIYASETLWRAKIDPQKSASSLTLKQFELVAKHAVNVLTEAIQAGGTTFRDYRDKEGNPGYFQKNLAVYGKNSMPCGRCGTGIVKITQGARSTFFCPVCQK
jgi:formamidopyrimidine-DNA glycosylase